MNKTLRNLALVALATAPFSAFADVKGAGTAADPYQIATAEDLCKAYELCASGSVTYFVQTADIDMKDVKDYSPLVGYNNGGYDKSINYDGRNHVIKNFAPTKDEYATSSNYCYGQTVFGVLSGELKNLGIVDADIKSAIGRMGIVAGYLGHGTALTKVTKVSNVYVTGNVTLTSAGTKYVGGMFGTTSGEGVEVTNCYANVNVKNESASAPGGAMFGTIGAPTKVSNCYVAGTVAGADLFTNSGAAKVTATDVVLFNTGSEKVADAEIAGITLANTEATKAAGLAEVLGWSAFEAGEGADALPVLKYALSGEGTEANPYIIDSPEALCNAYRYVNGTETGVTYFNQTADIDMEGIKLYHPISGWDGAYKASLCYDGQNHVIKNFAPVEPETLGGGGAANCESAPYYSTSIFGVLSGTLKNLGVINAVSYAKLNQGVGILGAYVGHATATATPTNTIENVFVTGTAEYAGTSSTYCGGMFGTTATPTTLKNCFANVEVTSETDFVGGLIGRVQNDSQFTEVYVAGKMTGSKAYLVAGGKACELDANVVAFNYGVDAATPEVIEIIGSIDVPADEAAEALAVKDVQDWDAFSATKFIDGYPILASFEAYGEEGSGDDTGIFDAAVEDADAPAVYYNLQGVEVANPENGVYIVRRGNKVTKELIRK